MLAATGHLAASCCMSLTPANVGRILSGVVLLFLAWCLGGYVGETICPGTTLVGGRESLAGKVGCSVAILAAAVIARRYLLRSLGLSLTCLGITELVVLLIILGFSGLTSFSVADISFNGWWLYALTWNVVVAFILGAAVGHLWDKRSATGHHRMKGFCWLVLLVTVMSTSGCITYSTVQRAKGQENIITGNQPAEPRPGYYALVPLTVPLDVATSPAQLAAAGWLYLVVAITGDGP